MMFCVTRRESNGHVSHSLSTEDEQKAVQRARELRGFGRLNGITESADGGLTWYAWDSAALMVLV